eukprot:2624648-Rhodomonas_salina.2
MLWTKNVSVFFEFILGRGRRAVLRKRTVCLCVYARAMRCPVSRYVCRGVRCDKMCGTCGIDVAFCAAVSTSLLCHVRWSARYRTTPRGARRERLRYRTAIAYGALRCAVHALATYEQQIAPEVVY